MKVGVFLVEVFFGSILCLVGLAGEIVVVFWGGLNSIAKNSRT